MLFARPRIIRDWARSRMRVVKNLTAITTIQQRRRSFPGQQLKNRTEGNLSDENVPNAERREARIIARASS